MTRRSPYVIELSAAGSGRAGAARPGLHRAVPPGDAGEDRAAGRRWAGEHGDRRPARRRGAAGVQVAQAVLRGGPGPVWKIASGPVGRGLFPPVAVVTSRRWPVSCPPRRGCRCRGGAPRSWRWRRSPAASWRRSRRPRCAAGWPRTPSSPGSTASWIFPRDPDFAAKAARALDLYAGVWDGEPLGENEFVVCADEKTSIQARCRCHPTLPPGKARMMRVEHEYQRKGALQYLAGYDVHRARVIGRTGAHHRDRAVRPAGRPGHDHRAVRQRGSGVLDRRQRVLAPRTRLGHADEQGLADRPAGAPAGTRVLVEPGGD